MRLHIVADATITIAVAAFDRSAAVVHVVGICIIAVIVASGV